MVMRHKGTPIQIAKMPSSETYPNVLFIFINTGIFSHIAFSSPLGTFQWFFQTYSLLYSGNLLGFHTRLYEGTKIS